MADPMGIDIEWNDALKLGFKPMDDQHERIVAIIAEIKLLLKDGSLAGSALPKMHQLREEVLFHFDFEENLMAKYEYSGSFEDHRKAHKAAISYINNALCSADVAECTNIMELFATTILDIIVRHDGDLVGSIIRSGNNIITDI